MKLFLTNRPDSPTYEPSNDNCVVCLENKKFTPWWNINHNISYFRICHRQNGQHFERTKKQIKKSEDGWIRFGFFRLWACWTGLFCIGLWAFFGLFKDYKLLKKRCPRYNFVQPKKPSHFYQWFFHALALLHHLWS